MVSRAAGLPGQFLAGVRNEHAREQIQALGVNALAPGTVARAYRELESAGLVASRVRHGTTVTAQPRPTAAQARDRLAAWARASSGGAFGPARPAGADPWTVNAADGGLVSHQGPSWRMIVAWTGTGKATGEGVYPGGQSENPASGWYEDQMADWWNGRYLTMPPAGGYLAGVVRWALLP